MSEKHVECLHSQISVVLFSDHLRQSILGGDQFGMTLVPLYAAKHWHIMVINLVINMGDDIIKWLR